MNGLGGDTRRAAGGRLDRLDSRRVGLAALILAMAACTALLLYLERGAVFMSDEWAWISISGTGTWIETLHPINQHLIVLPLLVFKGLLALWGLSFLPFKLAEIVGVLACSGCVYVFARSRVGPILALAPAMVPMFFGTATAILLQPLLGVEGVYSIAFGVGALIAVERNDRRADIVACVLTFLSVVSFSSGIPFLAGVAVAILLSKDRYRRAYVFLVPLVLYCAVRIWALQFGTGGGPELANVPALPFYFVDSFAATSTALFGREAIVGPGPGTSLFLHGLSLDNAMAALFFAAIEIGVVVFAARHLLRRGKLPVMLWSTLAVLLTLWISQGLVLADGRTPGEVRYLYPSAIALALVAVEAARDVRFTRLAIVTILCLTAVGIAGNLPRFKEGREGIAFHSVRAHAYTTAMELAGRNANPDFNPALETPEQAPAGALNFSVGQYLALSERFGSLAYSLPELMAQSEEIRHATDVVAVRMLQLEVTQAAHIPRRGCFRLDPASAGEIAVLPRGGAIVRAAEATPLALRRFANKAVVPVGRLKAGHPAEIRIPADHARAWEAWASVPTVLTVCQLPGG
jgi:hypothetical protein